MSTLKVMTFNVRFDLNQVPERQSAEDSLSGEQPWSLRKWKVADTILLYGPDIVGLQVGFQCEKVENSDSLSLNAILYWGVGAASSPSARSGRAFDLRVRLDWLRPKRWKGGRRVCSHLLQAVGSDTYYLNAVRLTDVPIVKFFLWPTTRPFGCPK